MVESKCSLSAQNYNGDTAFMIAARSNHTNPSYNSHKIVMYFTECYRHAMQTQHNDSRYSRLVKLIRGMHSYLSH